MGAFGTKMKNMFKPCGCGPEAREIAEQKTKDIDEERERAIQMRIDEAVEDAKKKMMEESLVTHDEDVERAKAEPVQPKLTPIEIRDKQIK